MTRCTNGWYWVAGAAVATSVVLLGRGVWSQEEGREATPIATGVEAEKPFSEGQRAERREREGAERPEGERAERRERAQEGRRREPGRSAEREVLARRIDVLRTALPALREGEKRDAVELLERAIRAGEVTLEGRRDEEAQRVRERAPSRGQLAEVLGVAADLWREFGQPVKAEAVAGLARQLTGGREAWAGERPALRRGPAPGLQRIERLERTVRQMHNQLEQMRRQMEEISRALHELAERQQGRERKGESEDREARD